MGIALLTAITVAALLVWLGRCMIAKQHNSSAKAECVGLLAQARAHAAATLGESALALRETLHALRSSAAGSASAFEEELHRLEVQAEARKQALGEAEAKTAEHERAVTERKRVLGERDASIRATKTEIAKALEMCRVTLEQVAGETRSEVRRAIVESMVEDVRGQALAELRNLESAAREKLNRDANRIITTAAERIMGHYLTERSQSIFGIPPEDLERVMGPAEANMRAIEEATQVKLSLLDGGDGLRIETQDGIARETARRTLGGLVEDSRWAGDIARLVQGVVGELEQEILGCGKRAFAVLRVPEPHLEIVTLVGKLNWRTSYTQNQWEHAIEAAWLAGILASELGLDPKLARRAGVMHDIGKSLTHAMDGSHAVIGADIARRLGESEIVANCIGSHHTEEPFGSTYALLVTAADAMSGGRPGARRQQEDTFGLRVEELERIATSFRGIDRVQAVHGGRELRVYVRDNEVDDMGCARLSGEIARRVSDEVVFPGQIKVTVIREMVVSEIAL